MRSCFLIFVVVVTLNHVQTERITIPGLGVIEGTTTESFWSNRTIYSFYGIRFAKSPSGPRRFMPPEPVSGWKGVYNATQPGRVCPQLHSKLKSSTYNTVEDLEDCLYLNVFTPMLPNKHNKSKRLPVMVYIHGGGFYENSARPFPPNYLLEENIILVVPQYRLGPLGFLSLQTDGISGNFGMMDMVASFEWVKKHISAFSGDKSRVTAVGQSAGAASILLMMMSPAVSDDLFHQVILQSGSGTNSWIVDEDPLNFATAYFKELTNTTSDDVDPKVMESFFRNATVKDLHKALTKVLNKDPLAKSSKVVIQDAGKVKFLEYHPADLFRIGRVTTHPMMTGVTKHDGSFVVTTLYQIFQANKLLDNSDYLKNNLTRDVVELFAIQDDNWALTDLLEEKYFNDLYNSPHNITFNDVVPGLIDVCGLLFFKSAIFRQAKINSNFSPTYLYTFDYSGEHTRFGYGEDVSGFPFDGGVHHSNDLLYLFPYHYESLNEDDRRIARILVDFWTSFIMIGRPVSPESEEWKPFSKGASGPYLHINETTRMDDNFVANEYKTF